MIWTALLLGAVGSLHCVGMCGPLALAMQGKTTSWGQVVMERLAYNMGRTLTYMVLGALAGFLGHGLVWVVGYQVYITAVLGIMLLLIGVFSVNPERYVLKIPYLGSFFQSLRKSMGKFLRKTGIHNYFTTGILNGFLPCGLVYMAMFNAVALGNSWEGAMYMLMFGLGTTPLMLVVTIAGHSLKSKVAPILRKLYPAVFIIMGSMLVWRAYNIGTAETIANPIEANESGVQCH
ncbi:sulfite exporter TauE/SafE family protein [Algivirga pacifica]|uniref:Sulfite exporter TauE/SafE family protein n=1 Tax=Algivirga pacifica TaxID=1162670 RepID=A0ABP9D3U1_9BACT